MNYSSPPAGYPLPSSDPYNMTNIQMTTAQPQQYQQAQYYPMIHNAPPIEQFIVSNKRPFLSPGLFATSPLLCIAQIGQDGKNVFKPFSLEKLELRTECHIATAFCEMVMTVNGSDLPEGEGVLFLPKSYDATITEVTITNLKKDEIYTTVIVPKDESERYANKIRGQISDNQPQIETDVDPELFVFPFRRVSAGSSFDITINWFQPLIFDQGSYKLVIPMEFPAMTIMDGVPLNKKINVEIAINTGVPTPVMYETQTHQFSVKEEIPGRVMLVSMNDIEWSNRDLIVTYKVWGQAIVATLNIQPPVKSLPDDTGTFILSVSPPAPTMTDTFQRSVVYIVDRSGSMTGDPVDYAKKALLTGLDLLHPDDTFNIIVYDHEQIHFSPSLISADPINIQNARLWIEEHVIARGLTDIMTPLNQGLTMLQNSGTGIPYVFLLTDGAVEDERAIAKAVQGIVKNPGPSNIMTPRISTFAIGPYCNHYFLKQLAIIGRGQFDVAFRPFSIQLQMERMMTAASKPVLTEVSIAVEGVNVELYPFPLPDLFVGLPLLVSGTYRGNFPETIELIGLLPNNQKWIQTVLVTMAMQIPLHRVLYKQKLDIITAEAWLLQNTQLMQKVVDLSVEAGIPNSHTSMLAMRTTSAKFREMQNHKQQGRKILPSKYAVGGTAAIAVLGGAALAIGFGSIAATVSNAPVLDAMTGDIGDVFGDIGEGLGDCCGAIGDCFGECFECLRDCCEGFGECCGNCMDCLGECDI